LENLFIRTFPFFRFITLNFLNPSIIYYILISVFIFCDIYEEKRNISFFQEFSGDF
jgi:hypothetical protein